MGPTWGPSGADRTQVGPVLAPWTLLSGILLTCPSRMSFTWLTRPCLLHITLFNQTHSSEIRFVNGWPGSSGIGIIAKGLFHHGSKSSCVFKRIQANKTYIICPFNEHNFKHKHSFNKHKNKHQTSYYTVVNKYEKSFVFSTMIHTYHYIVTLSQDLICNNRLVCKNLIKYYHKPLISSKVAFYTISYMLQVIHNSKPTWTLKRGKHCDYTCIDVANSFTFRKKVNVVKLEAYIRQYQNDCINSWLIFNVIRYNAIIN